ncbi:unnamed protein product [Paramecium primaurelia]|uniref:VTT domain-containing protein n=2 Tax=Paramecium TaxID=5884 RepID=A0A8S1SH33_9CILI|nr:unnamed protein product [Paramecium primaurelia]CAD8139815.1 unnamed protein product [Paramecium pentaurelia]
MNEQTISQKFYEDQSRELREKYQKAKDGGSNSQNNPKRDKAQRILLLIMILYSIILITFVLFLYWVRDFRYFCYNILNDFSEQGQIIGAVYIGLIGLWFVLTGFNVVLYDILAGYLIQPFWFALLTVSIAKFLAKYFGFLIGRYCVRNYIYMAMNENIYFITCYLATERKPVKVMYLIQFLAIPTIFKTYACGLFRITHWQFIHPTIFGTVVWAGFWVYMGSNLESLSELLQSGDTSNYVPFWLKLGMFITIVLIIYYFIKLTKQIYQEIQNDASLAELSHILEKEEEEEDKLINQQQESDL